MTCLNQDLKVARRFHRYEKKKYSQTAGMVQRRASTIESTAMVPFRSSVWYSLTADECHRTMRWQWFERMPRTWSKSMRHSDRSIGNSRCRPELNSANRIEMICRPQSAPAVRGTPVLFWSNWGSRLGLTWPPLRRWQTVRCGKRGRNYQESRNSSTHFDDLQLFCAINQNVQEIIWNGCINLRNVSQTWILNGRLFVQSPKNLTNEFVIEMTCNSIFFENWL